MIAFRAIDALMPGVGAAGEACWELTMALDAAAQAAANGDLKGENLLDVCQAIKDADETGKALEVKGGKKIKIVRHCSICKSTQHDRRKCPKK